MIPYPHELYMRALAEAFYSVAYLEWAILGDLPRLKDPPEELTIEALSRSTMGVVATKVRQAANSTTHPGEALWLRAAADGLEEVVEERNRLVHAHPATIDGEQVLHRWAAATSSKPHEASLIRVSDLEALRDLAYEHLVRLSEVRLPSE